eukprot:4237487-Karenia_brevis.AAC.1
MIENCNALSNSGRSGPAARDSFEPSQTQMRANPFENSEQVIGKKVITRSKRRPRRILEDGTESFPQTSFKIIRVV